jgi:hypothetical protein
MIQQNKNVLTKTENAMCVRSALEMDNGVQRRCVQTTIQVIDLFGRQIVSLMKQNHTRTEVYDKGRIWFTR